MQSSAEVARIEAIVQYPSTEVARIEAIVQYPLYGSVHELCLRTIY